MSYLGQGSLLNICKMRFDRLLLYRRSFSGVLDLLHGSHCCIESFCRTTAGLHCASLGKAASTSAQALESARKPTHDAALGTLDSYFWRGQRQSSHQFATTSSVSEHAEVAKFSALANEWWNPYGPFAPLHSMTPVRMLFIRRAVCQSLGLQEHLARPLEGKTVLDVGCGGGFLSESLARLGATVLGIDLSAETIGAAQAHAQNDPQLQSLLQYKVCSAGELADAGNSYDVVVASEVIEHVSDPPAFCSRLARLVRDDGAVVVSTLSRTARSYAAAIILAENISGVIPKGTHDWNKFLTPEDLVLLMEAAQLHLKQIAGMSLNLLSSQWDLTQDLGINYIACFQKQALRLPDGPPSP